MPADHIPELAPEAYAEMQGVVERFQDADTVRDAAAVAVDAALSFIGGTAAAVYEVEDDTFVPRAARAASLHGGDRRSVEDGVAGAAYRSDEPRLETDLASNQDVAATRDYGAAIAVPLDDGVFEVLADDPDAFDDADLAAAALQGTLLSGALDRIRTAAAAEHERDRFSALFDNVSDAALRYVVEDDDLVVESVNTAFVQTFGYAPDEATGRTVADLLVPGDSPGIERYQEAVTGDHEVTRVTDDGERTFLLRRAPVGDGGDRGYCIYTDISDRKDRERRLARQNERLERFASVVSHDLRNPLSVASGMTTLLADECDENVIESIQDAHGRMEEIIDDALTMAREGDPIEDPPRVLLENVARDAWETVETGDATLAVETDQTVAADPSRLRRAFENLFRNSVEHGGDVAVRVVETPTGFAVADDGPGIPEDHRADVFDPGFSPGEGGTGLGLAIVREIARAHDWTVAATESRAGGARFEFDLATE